MNFRLPYLKEKLPIQCLRKLALNFLSKMCSINSFSRVVQEILPNNYLKSNFKNSQIIDFVPTFWNFMRADRENLPKKSPLFRTLTANMSKTDYRKNKLYPYVTGK